MRLAIALTWVAYVALFTTNYTHFELICAKIVGETSAFVWWQSTVEDLIDILLNFFITKADMGVKSFYSLGIIMILMIPALGHIQNSYKNISKNLSPAEWTEPEGIWSSLLEEWTISNKWVQHRPTFEKFLRTLNCVKWKWNFKITSCC